MGISHYKGVPLSWANALWSVLAASYLGQGETEGFPVEVMGPDSFGSQVDHRRPSGLESLLAVPAFATHDAGFPTVRGVCPALHVLPSPPGRVRPRSSRRGLSGRPGSARRRPPEGWRRRVPPGAVLCLPDFGMSETLLTGSGFHLRRLSGLECVPWSSTRQLRM